MSSFRSERRDVAAANAIGPKAGARRRERVVQQPARPAFRLALVLGGLLALTFVVFYPAVFGKFVSDDVNAIVTNELVAGPLHPVEIFETFSWWGSGRADAPGYRPLATLSFALNRATSGAYPAPYHVVNFVLHALVSWLVLLIALSLGMGMRASLIAAVAFCLLPIHTEAVAWVVGRAELMAAAGWAAALLSFLAYRSSGKRFFLVAAAVSFLAGLLSKENAVTLLAAPVIVAALRPLPSGERRRDLLALGVLLATLTVYVAVRAAAGPLLPPAAGDALDNPLSVVGPMTRATGALSILGRYTALLIWPHPLTADYSFDALGIRPGFRGDAYTAFGVLAVAGFLWAVWASRRRAPAVAICLLLAAASYSIVSNTVVLIGTIMGERLVYLPTVGLTLAVAPPLAALTRRRPTTAWIALTLVAVAWGATCHQRSGDWRSPVTLFEAAVRATPESARAHMELGGAYGRAGRADEAVDEFQRAVAIKPDYAAALYNLGNLYARRGMLDAAADAYARALDRSPSLVHAWYNLAIVRQRQGRPADAAEAFARAAEIAPADGGILLALGDSWLAAGRYDRAIDAYDHALAHDAPAAVTLVNRGVAKERLHGCAEAVPDYLAATDEADAPVNAYSNAMTCLRELGRLAEAQAVSAKLDIAKRKFGR